MSTQATSPPSLPSPTSNALPPSFTNPYDASTGLATTCTSIILGTEDKLFIEGLRGRKGTIQTTVNILINKLVIALKSYGLKPGEYNPDAFERLVARCVIQVGLSADGIRAGATGVANSTGSGAPATGYAHAAVAGPIATANASANATTKTPKRRSPKPLS